jgi:hypothetical protein
MEPTRPPRFLDDPPHICPVLGPRSSRCVRPFRHIGAAPVIVTTKASAIITFRGSIARLLCSPPTLRARVTPMLRKDGFWPPASFTRWAWSPTGSFKKVSKCYCISSPFSKFSLARNDLLCCFPYSSRYILIVLYFSVSIFLVETTGLKAASMSVEYSPFHVLLTNTITSSSITPILILFNILYYLIYLR